VRGTVAIVVLLSLAACGKREDLRPETGHSLPQKPASAAKQPGTDELLKPGPEARPKRNTEQIRRSQEQEADPFDLPPSD
jgi:ABC-type uncharacterized transport system auxiliary subunit